MEDNKSIYFNKCKKCGAIIERGDFCNKCAETEEPLPLIIKPATEYKIEPTKEMPLHIIKEMIKHKWSLMYGELTKKDQQKALWSKQKIVGILVQCPCGQIQEATTLLTKTCVRCHRSFQIIRKYHSTRVVAVPKGKMGLYFQIYALTFYKKLTFE